VFTQVVNLENILPWRSLRGLLRARKTGYWEELRQVLGHGIAAKSARKPKISPLSFIQSWNSRWSGPPALFQMMSGYWVSQAVYVAAKLGIADVIQDSPVSCEQIARRAQVHADSLFRLLRALESIGICKRKKEKYSLTAHGRLLRSDVPGSLRSMALTLGEIHYQAWGNLVHSVRTGQPAFDDVFQAGLFQHLSERTDDGSIFNAAMSDFSGLVSCAVGLAYDFSGARSVIDVGGGHGRFLRTILQMNDHLEGMVFDLPSVTSGANGHLSGMNGRCTKVSGDFFAAVPSGADIYILCGVIHDWNDDRSIAVLRNCREAMTDASRILVVEMIVPGDRPSFSTLLDLNMLVMSGGRERMEPEFRTLFHRAGLEVTRIVSTLSPHKIIEGRRNSSH
jgi:hypothetical protein